MNKKILRELIGRREFDFIRMAEAWAVEELGKVLPAPVMRWRKSKGFKFRLFKAYCFIFGVSATTQPHGIAYPVTIRVFWREVARRIFYK